MEQVRNTSTKQYQPHCMICDESYDLARLHLGYAVCLSCGDEIAKSLNLKRTVVPMNKSNYQLVTDLSLLKQLNPKRTT